ncbi:YciI family protein [Chryseobacterium echinoideorum]|uniref:YciI family protein n=1 Tax=Chryseobacterium echinoideorum TaxID=1549648 RepID=UPI0011856BC4|nr:YciI family protein [Chryseobacterium echinoideorum]
MKEFVLLFRMDITNQQAQPTKEQMDIYMQQWMAWINEIEENGQLADGGNHFSREGRVLKPNSEIIEKPFTADDISVAGYIIILADSMEGATKIAQKCPILNGQNTSVEIRETAQPG